MDGSQQPRVPTTEKLAKALEAAKAPQAMIEKARSGYYDDYQSPIGANIQALVLDARVAGLHDIANRAIGGEFDGQDWEADQWMSGPEGQEIMQELVGSGPIEQARQEGNRAQRRTKARRKQR